MAKASPIITNFSKGELSPRLQGRTDTTHYFNGAATLQNWVVFPQGGLDKTPGTMFVSRVKTDSQVVRLVPFEFSTTQAYVLEFNGGKMRVYKDRSAVLETALNITGATQANPCVVTSAGHGYSNGDEVYITGVVGMTQLNGKRYKVAGVTANTFELTDYSGTNINSTAYTAYSSGGTVARVYEITIPYAAADLSKIQWAQDDDLMYIVHPSYDVRKLTRSGHTSWTLSTVTWDTDHWPPFRATNVNTSLTMTASAASGAITITASSAFFTASMVGGYIRISTGYALITGYTSTTQVNATTQANVPTSAQTDWAIGAFSAQYGYPSCVTFFEQRLTFASTSGDPQSVWLSKVEEYENFKTGSNDDDGMLYTIASKKVNVIEWLEPLTQLVLGTSSGPFNLGSGSQDQPLTPSNVVVRQQSSYQCAEIPAVAIGNQIYYVQKNGRKIREYSYEFASDSFKAGDITIISEHITQSGIVEMAYQQNPNNVIWCVLTNGKICTLTREVDQQVYAWTKQVTDGTYENIAVIPNPSGGYDEVWVVVKRNINGSDRRYVEYFVSPFTDDAAQEDAFFVHSGLTYDSTPATTISGLDHLEGESVTVFADGAVQNSKTVASGAITLDHSASVVQVGLSYSSILKTMPIEYGASNGTAQTKWKKIFDIFVRLYRTLGLKVGDATAQDEVPFRTTSDPMDDAPPLFTGDKRVKTNNGWDRDQQIYVVHDSPTPCTLLALILNPMETSE